MIAIKDFSITPGSRYKDEGARAHSGQEFRENFLEDKFIEAIDKKVKLIVDLDGTIGFGTSFLEEVFGGLARKFGKKEVKETLDFISNEEPYLIKDIKEYIEHA